MSRAQSKPIPFGVAGDQAEELAEERRQRRRLIARWILAGPLAFIVSVLIMASMPMWMPKGAGNVNHLAFSVLLFPAIWVALVTYVLLEENLKRASVLFLILFFANGVPVVLGIMKMLSAMQSGGAA
ncbi:MAG: hypothetical protein AAGF57_17185 [Pseudomonadota bacterium]